MNKPGITSGRARGALIFIFLACATACSGSETLQQAFEKQMKTDGADGFDLIHLQENEQDGLVLSASWTEAYPDNRDEPSVFYFQKQDGRWTRQTGTACSQSGVSRVGLMGNGYLYCSVLRDDWDFAKVRVGETEAKMFQTHAGRNVWYAVAEAFELPVVGVGADGREWPLN